MLTPASYQLDVGEVYITTGACHLRCSAFVARTQSGKYEPRTVNFILKIDKIFAIFSGLRFAVKESAALSPTNRLREFSANSEQKTYLRQTISQISNPAITKLIAELSKMFLRNCYGVLKLIKCDGRITGQTAFPQSRNKVH